MLCTPPACSPCLAVLIAMGGMLQAASFGHAQPPPPRRPSLPAETTPPRPPREDTRPPSDSAVPAEQADAPPGEQLVPAQAGFLMNVSVNRPDANYTQGERLRVKFRSEKDAYVYLLYHQADGQTVIIFPNRGQADHHVTAKTDVAFPAAGDGFRFRIAPPFGEEALQVIASLEKIEALEKLQPQSKQAVPAPPEVLRELGRQIQQTPERFAEHRIVIHTHAGGGPLPQTPKAQRHGLFIGVDRLQRKGLGKEHPAVKGSAKLMHAAMTEFGGVDPQRAKLITGPEATLANIQSAVTGWLVKSTRPGDTVFIFYCGHGGQIDALDDSELDGKDELLTTYDTDPERLRETSIADDRLARWLQELPGRQIVLMVDSCHSGGLVDGPGLARAMVDESRRLRDVSRLNTIILTACLPDEDSAFFSKKVTEMPRLLVQAMFNLPTPLTVQDAFRYYVARVGPQQAPNLTDHALLPVHLAIKSPPQKKKTGK